VYDRDAALVESISECARTAIATKAITAMQSGTAPATAWQQYQTAVVREGNRYGTDTANGKMMTAQQAWESDIDNQNVVFP
jgi:hypothetical protein